MRPLAHSRGPREVGLGILDWVAHIQAPRWMIAQLQVAGHEVRMEMAEEPWRIFRPNFSASAR